MLGEGGAGWVSVAGNDVDDAWREAGFLDKFCGGDGLDNFDLPELVVVNLLWGREGVCNRSAGL